MRSSDPPEPRREGEHAETVHPDDVTLNPEEYQVLDTDDEDFAGLKQSIKQEGVNEPILLNAD